MHMYSHVEILNKSAKPASMPGTLAYRLIEFVHVCQHRLTLLCGKGGMGWLLMLQSGQLSKLTIGNLNAAPQCLHDQPG